MSDSWHQVKYQKQLPYTVKDLDTNCPLIAKAKMAAWQAEVDARSLHAQRIVYKRAVNVVETQPYILAVPKGKTFMEIQKPSIITRIYNWFLNINITY